MGGEAGRAPSGGLRSCACSRTGWGQHHHHQVPVFGPGMHPRSLVHVTELEESVYDGKTQFRADRKQPETAAIHVANTMMSNDSMPYVMISAYPGIEIAQQYDFAILRNSSEG